jgi:hypothetical protein
MSSEPLVPLEKIPDTVARFQRDSYAGISLLMVLLWDYGKSTRLSPPKERFSYAAPP